jgi:hypothetical protein
MNPMRTRFLTASARLSALEPFSISPEEQGALMVQFEQLSRALEALAAFVGQDAEPATGFDPLLGSEG